MGGHLRKTRLDRELSQGDVAGIRQVDTDTVTAWEMNRHESTVKIAKSIFAFLGYFPFSYDGESLGKQLYYARLIRGVTQRQIAIAIGCDASTLIYIELDQRKPQTKTREKVQAYINAALACLQHGSPDNMI